MIVQLRSKRTGIIIPKDTKDITDWDLLNYHIVIPNQLFLSLVIRKIKN